MYDSLAVGLIFSQGPIKLMLLVNIPISQLDKELIIVQVGEKLFECHGKDPPGF